MTPDRIGVIGAGAWGTALAVAARRAGHRVVLWAREREIADAINDRHENPAYLPGVTLDPGIAATTDPARAADAGLVLLVTPAQHLRAVASLLAPHWRAGTPAVICAKGIEEDSGLLLSQVLAGLLPAAPQAVLSGPTFAREVAQDLPTAATVAAANPDLAARLAAALATRRFRLYAGDDPIGAQIGGAVKNVIAIAAGVVAGRRLGDNARAALITRGLAEMGRLAAALGARPGTMMGLTGLGDLTLTCSAPQSRNFSLGIALGEGRALGAVLAERRSVAEGVHTARSVGTLARRVGVEMPICAAVERVLHHGAPLDAAIEGLLSRPLTAEMPRDA